MMEVAENKTEKGNDAAKNGAPSASGDGALGHVAAVIREFRRTNDFSLDELATRSGVSRSMICQIERERAMPTIQVIVKLARAMEKPVGALVDPCGREAGVAVRSLSEQPRIVSDDGACTARSVTAGSTNRSIEILEISFERQGRFQLPSLPSGATAFLTLSSGKVSLETPAKTVSLLPGKAVELSLPGTHTMVQETPEFARGTFVIHFRC